MRRPRCYNSYSSSLTVGKSRLPLAWFPATIAEYLRLSAIP
jgi:hypothetical protein